MYTESVLSSHTNVAHARIGVMLGKECTEHEGWEELTSQVIELREATTATLRDQRLRNRMLVPTSCMSESRAEGFYLSLIHI